jgi:hypothetical protein
LLSLDARRAFTGPYSDDCRRHFSSAPRSHLLNTVVVRTRPQTERATDSALGSACLPTQHRPEHAASQFACGATKRRLGSAYVMPFPEPCW